MTERKSRDAPPPRPRGLGPRPVAEMLPQVGGAAFRRFGFVQSAVVSRWAEIVGARFADVSAPESIRFPAGKRRDGVLTLGVAPAHGPMMQHVAPAIIERVNQFFGYPAVARVAIRPGTIAVAQRSTPPAPRPVPADLGESLRSIADPELRECLGALAGALAGAASVPIMGKVR